MSTRAALRWLLTGVTFLSITAAAFIPALFLLASTPLHDGDVLPGPLLLSATLLLSAALGAGAAWLVDRRGRAWRRAQVRPDPEGAHRQEAATPLDSMIENDTVRSPPCAPPGARHRER
jgi:hypothetical protein